MALFNYATRELSAKVVYYGPGLSGKTTNIEMVHKLLLPEQKGKLISLPTETDRTLFFDFLPLDLGEIKGFRVRFHLYTVPGQVFYNATRRLVLQGVDGVVFVADSQKTMMESNVESFRNLVDNLATYGKKLSDLPFVIQYNKRDLKNLSTVAELNARLNANGVPCFEGVAKDGVGVTETLIEISRLVFDNLRRSLLLPTDREAAAPAVPRAAAATRAEEEPLEEISEISEIEEIPHPPPAEPPGFGEGPPGEIEIPIDLDLPEEGAAPAFGTAGGAAGESPPEAGFSLEGLEEIEIEIPERAPGETGGEGAAGIDAAPEPGIGTPVPPPAARAGVRPAPEAPPVRRPPARAAVSVEAEGGGLVFLKFEDVVVSTEGYVVLPAVFLDTAGTPVTLRIKLSFAESED